ncbi:hypothetical protein SFRURICE_012772 [Spodoptera frugiperda]|nr:hypothetical protein SFRURICE_012772 [Spodoptera frugiperda]
MVTVTAAVLGAASLTTLFKGAVGALLAAGAAGVVLGAAFFPFPLFTTSVLVSVGGVAESSPASSGWLRGAAWTVPSSTCASAHVLGASGAAAWDFLPFLLPLEGFGPWAPFALARLLSGLRRGRSKPRSRPWPLRHRLRAPWRRPSPPGPLKPPPSWLAPEDALSWR